MNGHTDEGVDAYGPGDEMEIIAAILAAHDDDYDPAWFEALGDDDDAPAVFCPYCAGLLVPLPGGRTYCPDCGAEFGDDDPPAELAALNKVRFTIEVHPGGGWTATATDWNGGDQWNL